MSEGFSPTPVAIQTALRLDSITYVAGRTLLDDVSVTFPALSLFTVATCLRPS